MSSTQKKVDKIDYRALRCDLLRQSIEALLAVIQKPDPRAFRVWQQLARDYHDLTTRNAPSVPVASSLRELRRQLDTAHDRETMWLRLLDEVMGADQTLENKTGSMFFEKFKALSPFNRMQLFHVRRGLGPSSEQRVESDIARLKRLHGFATDPTFRREINSSVFVSFDANAGGSGQAAA